MWQSRFYEEDSNIVRLEAGNEDGLVRSGWVNVGAFSINILTDTKGDLVITVHPCANEMTTIHTWAAEKAQAMLLGAMDLDG